MNTLKEKLEASIDVITKVPDEQFRLSFWKNNYECGAIGCVIGWSASDERFINDGFRLNEPTCTIDSRFEPVYKEYFGWDAVTQYFGLTYNQAQHLFDRYSYPAKYTKQDVIDRIREFINATETP